MSFDLALFQGFLIEMNSTATGGVVTECQERNAEPYAQAGKIGKNQGLAALCGNCCPDGDIGLHVCFAPSQVGQLPEPAPEMARVCRNDRNRFRLHYPRMSAIMGESKVLGTPGSLFLCTFRLGGVCPSERASRAFGALRGADAD